MIWDQNDDLSLSDVIDYSGYLLKAASGCATGNLFIRFADPSKSRCCGCAASWNCRGQPHRERSCQSAHRQQRQQHSGRRRGQRQPPWWSWCGHAQRRCGNRHSRLWRIPPPPWSSTLQLASAPEALQPVTASSPSRVWSAAASADTLTGNSGANTLNGSAGADLMRGLAGHDTYFVDNASDVVDESIGGSSGHQRIVSSRTFSLSDAAHAKGAIEHPVTDRRVCD